ncbi:isoprenylcysteine carboxylmethyltransferase family protein [Candidatus Bathyarchaeota archaeon]|nr:isoprenylcysteine carboxylmethyltransferase family protein [Candidatus Bathyarchaeota archaeon]
MDTTTLVTIIGLFLAVAGGIICAYWYIYWNQNFKGELITDGMYGVVRHPFYTGFILMALGITIAVPMYETRFLAVMTLAVMYVFIPREEQQLIQEYGEEYREYMKKVKYRLIPYII